MNQPNSRRPYRPLFADLAIAPELVSPLSGPSYGPFNVARRRWRKPLPAIIADAIANGQGLAARLQRGMWMPPDEEKKAHYEKIFHQLCRATRAQLEALEAFREINWRE